MEENSDPGSNTDKKYGTFAPEENTKDEQRSLLGKEKKEETTNLRVGYDDILEEIGEFGPWQQWLAALFWIPPVVSGAIFMLGSFTSIVK